MSEGMGEKRKGREKERKKKEKYKRLIHRQELSHVKQLIEEPANKAKKFIKQTKSKQLNTNLGDFMGVLVSILSNPLSLGDAGPLSRVAI